MNVVLRKKVPDKGSSLSTRENGDLETYTSRETSLIRRRERINVDFFDVVEVLLNPRRQYIEVQSVMTSLFSE